MQKLNKLTGAEKTTSTKQIMAAKQKIFTYH